MKYRYASYSTLMFMVLIFIYSNDIASSVITSSGKAFFTQGGVATKKTDDSSPVSINGEYLKAFLIAHQAFETDAEIPLEKRKIENYRVTISQHGNEIIVLFVTVRLPNETSLKGGSSTLGRDVQYRIRKKDYQIISKSFFK